MWVKNIVNEEENNYGLKPILSNASPFAVMGIWIDWIDPQNLMNKDPNPDPGQ